VNRLNLPGKCQTPFTAHQTRTYDRDKARVESKKEPEGYISPITAALLVDVSMYPSPYNKETNANSPFLQREADDLNTLLGHQYPLVRPAVGKILADIVDSILKLVAHAAPPRLPDLLARLLRPPKVF